MGSQLNLFIQGIGTGLEGRTCQGELPDDSTFRIAFNYDGVDVNQLGFCNNLPSDTTAPKDPYYQFYMTQLRGGSSDRISFPYSPTEDNHYAIASSGKDVLQCKVIVNRDTSGNYKIAIYDSNGSTQGSASKKLTTKGPGPKVPGQAGLLDLAVVVEDPVGKPGTVGGRVDFNYGATTRFMLGTFFFFSSNSFGVDTRLSDMNPDVTRLGGYCLVPNIEDDGTQEIQCYFPCNAS